MDCDSERGYTRFHEHLAAKLTRMCFKPSRTDLDLWYCKVGDYYEYIATYVDDILAFSKDPMKLIGTIKEDYVLKGVGIPEYYGGWNVEEACDPKLLEKGVRTILSAKTYIHNVLGKLENMFDGGPFKKCSTPMMEAYHPELDDSLLFEDYHDGQLTTSGHRSPPIGLFGHDHNTLNWHQIPVVGFPFVSSTSSWGIIPSDFSGNQTTRDVGAARDWQKNN